MAHLQYLVFNNENIPMPASYSVSLSDVEADSGGVTEAGTTQRDVVREGVVQIGVTFRVSKKWLNKFSAYKKLASITVGYLDMETMNIVDTQMYIGRISGEAGQRYKLWELVGGEFFVERVLTFTIKEKINADRRGYAKWQCGLFQYSIKLLLTRALKCF